MAIRCGVSVADYNDMTPRELMMIVDGYNARKQAEREEALSLAYMTAYWQRLKKLPPLKNVLEKARPKQRQLAQTPEQMLALAMRLQAGMREEG